jgi:hypothetical protein
MLSETPRRPWDASHGWLGQESLIVTDVAWDSSKALRCLKWLDWKGKLDSHRCYLRLHEGLEMPQMVGLDKKAWKSLMLPVAHKASNGWIGQESLLVTDVTWDSTKALRCLTWFVCVCARPSINSFVISAYKPTNFHLKSVKNFMI